MIDVLVVGGGPAGLAAAIGCAQAGLSVTVAEPRSGPIDKACGEGLMPSAVRRLAAIGVRPQGRALHGIRYLDSRGQVDARFRPGHGLGVRRTVLHNALAERAAGLGIDILPVRVTSFGQRARGVTAAGVEARFLIAADGLHSAIRRACGLDPRPARHPRYGLRRHFRIAPWADLVEVHWSAGSEAYVTPVADDLVGVALLGKGQGGFESRLAAFPALRERLAGAEPVSSVRGAGPLRQDVQRRRSGRVLLVGDASGYLDALTGEGIGAALAQATVLAECLAAGRAGDYERAWRRVTRKSRVLTSGLLWSANQQLIGPRLAAAARRLPWLFTALVNQAGEA